MNSYLKNNFSVPLIFALASLFVSCGKKKVEIPRGVLSKEEIIPVLADMHLAQAAIGMSASIDSVYFSTTDYAAYILKSHHITPEKYKSSMAFYTSHPEVLDEIYQEVINELSKKQSEAERK